MSGLLLLLLVVVLLSSKPEAHHCEKCCPGPDPKAVRKLERLGQRYARQRERDLTRQRTSGVWRTLFSGES